MTRILSVFNILKRVGFAVLLLTFYSNLKAQIPRLLWSNEYGTENTWSPVKVIPTPGGTFMLAGYRYYPDTSDVPLPRPYVRRIDQFGNLLWTREYYRSTSGYPEDVIIQSDGNGTVFVGSYSHQSVIQATEANGDAGRTVRLYQTGSLATGILARPDGGYAVSTEPSITSASLAFLSRSLEVEDTVEYRFGPDFRIEIAAITQGPDGYFLWGHIGTFSPSPDGFRGIMIATDFEGDTLFTRRFSYGDYSVVINSVAPSPGGFFVASTVTPLDNNERKALFTNVTYSGQVTWERTLSTRSFGAGSLVQTPDNGYVFLLDKFPTTFLVKFNSLGDSLWAIDLPYPDSFWNVPASVCIDVDGGYVIAMSPTLQNAVHTPDVLQKFSADASDSIAAASRSKVRIVWAGQNYPNPFNGVTTLPFTLSKDRNISLTVFDILGRQVSTVAEGFLDAGYYAFPFDGGALPSGTYFYQIKAGSITDTKRFVKLK